VENRADWVDCAKAIGIILVVFGHVTRGIYNAGVKIPVDLYRLTDSIIYSFHMPLFFFLSGLFFYSSFSKRGGKQLVFSKIDTVFYPYVAWSILQGCIEIFMSDYTNGNVSYSEVFALLWAPRAQFWFLYALFVVFVAASAIYSIVSKRFSALVFLFATSLYLFPIGLFEQQAYKFLSQNLVFFSFGVIFTMYANVKHLSTVLPLLGMLFSFIVGQWLFHDYLSLEYTGRGIESLLLALISIIFVVSLSAHLSKKSYRFLAFIGSSSMAIYLMHILAGSGARVILTKLVGIDSFAVHLLLGCLIGVLAPLVVLTIINRLKTPYIFFAPVSAWLVVLYNKALPRCIRWVN